MLWLPHHRLPEPGWCVLEGGKSVCANRSECVLSCFICAVCAITKSMRNTLSSAQGISNGSSGGSAISPEGFRFNICDEPARCVEDPVDGISLWFRAVWRRVRLEGYLHLYMLDMGSDSHFLFLALMHTLPVSSCQTYSRRSLHSELQ